MVQVVYPITVNVSDLPAIKQFVTSMTELHARMLDRGEKLAPSERLFYGLGESTDELANALNLLALETDPD